MNSFIERLMYENTRELSRLMREGRAAAENCNVPLLKLKMAGLQHAMDVGQRLVQLKNLWTKACV